MEDGRSSFCAERQRTCCKSRQRATQQSREIVIPTPVLTELMVRAGAAGQQYLQELTKSAQFTVSPYDTRAAVEVAAAIRGAIVKGKKKGGSSESWAKVNFDRQIAAICKVEGAHTIYTGDEKLGKFAVTLGLKIVKLADLPIPPSKHPLLDILDEIQTPVPPPPEGESEP